MEHGPPDPALQLPGTTNRDRMPSLSIGTSSSDLGRPSRQKRGSSVRLLTARRIQRASEEAFALKYRLGEEVMESTNAGIRLLWAVRLKDGLECVVKAREKPGSFKCHGTEREWRRTTEMQLGMPKTEWLVEIYEVLETDSMYYVVMERAGGKDLFEVLGDIRPAREDARAIIRQTLQALVVLHGHGRIHKDIKIENVMVDFVGPSSGPCSPGFRGSPGAGNSGSASPATAKLIDFDTVDDWEPSSPKATEVLGTDGYIAPEAYLGQYSPASDMYAVGVVMYKVLVGEFPNREDLFDDEPGENWVGSPQMKRIYEKLRHDCIDFTRPPLDADQLAADLLSRLLAFEAADRPEAQAALEHPWFFNLTI